MTRVAPVAHAPHTNGHILVEKLATVPDPLPRNDLELSAAQQRMLNALATFEQLGVAQLDRANLATWIKLDRAPAAMLRVLIAAYPPSVARETLAEQTGQSPKSSAFDGHVRQLRSLGLVASLPDKQIVATRLLFPERIASPV